MPSGHLSCLLNTQHQSPVASSLAALHMRGFACMSALLAQPCMGRNISESTGQHAAAPTQSCMMLIAFCLQDLQIPS